MILQGYLFKNKLDLRKAILLDIQSKIDISCNQSLVGETTNSKNKMQLKNNGSTMTVSQKATVTDNHNSVWCSKTICTNIIVLINIRLQYRVTYRNNKMIFIFHRESKRKPNMKF